MELSCSLRDGPACGGHASGSSTLFNGRAATRNLSVSPLAEALNDLEGVVYEPAAYLGNQVIGGLNHCYLCRATVVYPDAQPSWKLVFVYEPLDGPAEITRIANLDLASLATPLNPD